MNDMTMTTRSLDHSNRRYPDRAPYAESVSADAEWFRNAPRRNLSQRERQVLKLFLTGMPHAEIAKSLKISASTVNGHICAIFNTTGFRRRAELAAWAARNLSALFLIGLAATFAGFSHL